MAEAWAIPPFALVGSSARSILRADESGGFQSFLTQAETRVVQVVEGPRGTNDDGQHPEHAHRHECFALAHKSPKQELCRIAGFRVSGFR